MAWGRKQVVQMEKTPEKLMSDYAFREKKSECLLICRSDYMLTRLYVDLVIAFVTD